MSSKIVKFAAREHIDTEDFMLKAVKAGWDVLAIVYADADGAHIAIREGVSAETCDVIAEQFAAVARHKRQ